MYLLKYALHDGLIVGCWAANRWEELAPNVVAEDPTYGYLAYDGPEPPQVLCGRKRVVQGVLADKPQATITATPATFAANGSAVSRLTVQPFVPCTLIVDGTPVGLTSQDPTLQLTSNEPHLFRVTLESTALAWAEPVSVEAI